MNPYGYFETQDGCKLRYGEWTRFTECHTLNPTILLLQGRASFLEKFEKLIYGFCSRGYNVWSFDWRGQGLSSRLLTNQRKGHIDCYETYLDDLHVFLHQKVLPSCPGPLVVVGQSMGSHLALRYMTDYSHSFDYAVLTAPMIDLNTGGYSKFMAEMISKISVKMGLGATFVLGHGVYDPIKEPFEGNMLTHDRESFLQHRALQKGNPHLSIGGVTYGWAHATFKSIHKLNNPSVLNTINIPLLVLAAGQESVVDNYRLKEVISWIPKADLKIYEHARHQILSESPTVMAQFWKDFDNYMKHHIPHYAHKPKIYKNIASTYVPSQTQTAGSLQPA